MMTAKSRTRIDPSILFGQAIKRYNQGQLSEADALCGEVLASAPNHPNCLHLRGLIYLRCGKTRAAIPLLKRALAQMPGAAEPAMHLANALAAEGRASQALTHYDTALARNASYAEAHFNRARALETLERVEMAEAGYREAIACRPDYAAAHVNLTVLLKNAGRIDEALETCKSALDRVPDSAPLRTNLANLLSLQNKPDQAVDQYRRAVELDPRQWRAHSNLGVLLQERGDHAGAAEAFARADTPYARAKALECRLHIEPPEAVSRDIARAAEREPHNRRVAALSAYVSERCGTPDPFDFCPTPFEFVSVRPHLGGIQNATDLIGRVRKQVMDLTATWEPSGTTTRKGYQTNDDLFDQPNGALAKLKAVVEREIDGYRERITGAECTIARDWPRSTSINAWFVRLLSGGHQAPHIHPRAWLSGVLYLALPPTDTPNAGAIEFSLWGEHYPELCGGKGPALLHEPAMGELILFPSTLYHRTLPFSGDSERLSIAFDVIPAD